MPDVTLREEQAGDALAIGDVHSRAFGRSHEAQLVDALRATGASVVSEVALSGQDMVGHVIFSPVRIEKGSARVLGLGPVAVVPEQQRKGIGAVLIRHGLMRARQVGARAVVVLGEPGYYGRFGFQPARRFALHCKWPGTEEAFMALELYPGALQDAQGLVSYHRAFDAID